MLGAQVLAAFRERYKMNITLIPAAPTDYPLIQNMARFYVYDLFRECGFISSHWVLPSNGSYEKR